MTNNDLVPTNHHWPLEVNQLIWNKVCGALLLINSQGIEFENANGYALNFTKRLNLKQSGAEQTNR